MMLTLEIKMFIRQTQYEPIYEFKYAAETTPDRKYWNRIYKWKHHSKL